MANEELLIFIHIPKTGGMSIKQTLGKLVVNIGHNSYKTYVRRRDMKWNERFKFASIRNPYDRLVSNYYFALQHPGYQIQRADVKWFNSVNSFEQFVRELKSDFIGRNLLFRPQHHFIVRDNKVVVDRVLRFENLGVEFEELFGPPLPITNRSRHQKWESLYTTELRQKTFDLYAKDFEAFAYEK